MSLNNSLVAAVIFLYIYTMVSNTMRKKEGPEMSGGVAGAQPRGLGWR